MVAALFFLLGPAPVNSEAYQQFTAKSAAGKRGCHGVVCTAKTCDALKAHDDHVVAFPNLNAT
jgi:hypothetical protein